MSDTDLRLAQLERRLARVEEYADALERALCAALPECNGETGACLHCAASRELDSVEEPEVVEAVRATA